jgi:hypothetical protein
VRYSISGVPAAVVSDFQPELTANLGRYMSGYLVAIALVVGTISLSFGASTGKLSKIESAIFGLLGPVAIWVVYVFGRAFLLSLRAGG